MWVTSRNDTEVGDTFTPNIHTHTHTTVKIVTLITYKDTREHGFSKFIRI